MLSLCRGRGERRAGAGLPGRRLHQPDMCSLAGGRSRNRSSSLSAPTGRAVLFSAAAGEVREVCLEAGPLCRHLRPSQPRPEPWYPVSVSRSAPRLCLQIFENVGAGVLVCVWVGRPSCPVVHALRRSCSFVSLPHSPLSTRRPDLASPAVTWAGPPLMGVSAGPPM